MSRGAAVAIDDALQRAHAIDVRQSFIVQAPAGSGKTELLIQRYLALLAAVDEAEQIVAITFTIKAAAEMRGRVLAAMDRAAREPEPAERHERLTWSLARAALEQDHRRGWQLENNPSRLRIQTIDALCLAIARRMPLTSQLGGAPAIQEDPVELYREAARNTLLHLSPDSGFSPAVERLAIHLDNRLERIEELLAAMLARRDQWLRFTGSGGQDREAVRLHLERNWRDILAPVLARANGLLPAALREDLACCAWPNQPSFPAADPQDLPRWQALTELLLTGKGDFRRAVNKRLGFAPGHPLKNTLLRILRTLEGHEALRVALIEVRDLPAPVYNGEQWRILEALLELLPVAAAELALVFARSGTCDFAQISFAAEAALGQPENPADLALILGERVRHVLVDEFQDTSFSQIRLIRQLTAAWDESEGRTIFLVGDPMQSIYRFREAEVGLFLDVRRGGLPAAHPAPLTLTANFRSQAGIVEWVNETFPSLFPAEEDPAAGAVPYAPSTPVHPALDDEAIAVHPLFADDRAREPELVAELVAKTIREDPKSTVGILVRARSHTTGIARELAARGIRFRAVDLDVLAARPAVQDLLALTRALWHPGDRAAWLACLRAPWTGLTLIDLELIAGADNRACVWDLLFQNGLALPHDSAVRLARFRDALQPMLARRGRIPLRQLVEGAWLRLGGPACLSSAVESEEAEQFLRLLARLDRGGDLPSLDELNRELARLYAPSDSEAPDNVQVMTMHKAKGLQFDTVILPGLGRPTRSGDPPLLRWLELPFDGEPRLLLAARGARSGDRDPHYDFLARFERKRERWETRRLLYVAATRAKRRLHLIGHAAVDDVNRECRPMAGSLLECLWARVEPIFHAALPDWLAAHGQPGAATAPSPLLLRRLPSAWTASGPPPAVRWQPDSPPVTEDTEQPPFEWVGDTLRHAGTVVHGWLRRIAEEGVDQWNSTRVEALRPVAERWLASLGVPPGELDAGAGRVIAALRQTLDDGRGHWILTRHAEDRREYDVAGSVDGRIVQRTIDVTFIDETGVRWIVDYKTSFHAGGGLDAFLDEEVERYRSQMEFYARLLRPVEARPVRLGLYFPLLGGWRAWAAGEGGAVQYSFSFT